MSRRSKKINDFQRREESSSQGAFDEDLQIGYKNLTHQQALENQVDNLYYGNMFFRRIIDEIPADSMKKGFEVEFYPKNETLSEKLISQFEYLQLDNYIVELMQRGRKDGFSALVPIITGFNLKTDVPLELKNVGKILDFNTVYKSDVVRIDRQLDITKPKFSEIEYVYVRNPSGNVVKYHSSWLIIFETGIRANRNTHDMCWSLYSGLIDGLEVNYNINWSSGQYAFSTFAKVLKIGSQQEFDKIKNLGLSDYKKKKEMEINSSTLAVIGSSDTLESVNLGGNADFENIQKVNLNDLACRIGIPVSKLMGASSGALASAEQDADKYVEVVEQFQSDIVKDLLIKLLDLILASMNIYDSHYEIEFNSIKVKDSKKEAEIDKMESESNKIKAEAFKIKLESIITANKELNDETVAGIIKSLVDKLKNELLEDLNE